MGLRTRRTSPSSATRKRPPRPRSSRATVPMVRTAPGQPGSPAGLQDPPGGPGSYTARERVASLIRRRHLSPYLLLPSVAAIDGAGPVRIFWRIMLPLVAPGLVATSVFAFIFAWNEFVFALTFLGTDTAKFTLPIYVQYFYGRGSVAGAASWPRPPCSPCRS